MPVRPWHRRFPRRPATDGSEWWCGRNVTHSGPHWFSWFHTYGRSKRHDERCGCMTTSWGVRTSVSMRSSSISTSMPWRDSASSVNSANADWRSSTISAAMTPGAGRLSVSSKLSSRSQKMSRLALSLPSDRRRPNGGTARSPSAFPAPLPCSCRRSRRGRLGARPPPQCPRPSAGGRVSDDEPVLADLAADTCQQAVGVGADARPDEHGGPFDDPAAGELHS